MAPPTQLPTITTLTLAYFLNALRARLASSFWLDDELKLYVQEAIRTWNAAAAFYRHRVSFTTETSTLFYDLTSKLEGLLKFSIKDVDLIKLIEYQLLESATPTSWTGTDMFTLDELTKALERRRNQLLGETGIKLTNYAPPVSSLVNGRLTLQDSLMDLRRAAWKDGSGSYTRLWREDEHNLNHFLPGWSGTPGTPQAYSIIASPPFTLQFAPYPSASGALDLLIVAAGAVLDPATGVLLGVPDDFAWVVKWGALSDLLRKDSQARDPTRAEYCERRWREGVQLARLFSPIVSAWIDGLPVPVGSLQDLDTVKPDWMNSTAAPTSVAVAGGNILSLDSVPDSLTYSVQLDVVAKAPVAVAWQQVGLTWDEVTQQWQQVIQTWDAMLKWGEASLGDTDPLNLTSEAADAILDYAHHLACFKMGGQEFLVTVPAYERLMQLAAVHNDRLRANAANFEVLSGQSLREARQHPRRSSDVEVLEIA